MIINLSDILQEGHNTILQHGFQEEKKNSFYSIIFSRKKIRLYDERSRNAYTSSCHQLESNVSIVIFSKIHSCQIILNRRKKRGVSVLKYLSHFSPHTLFFFFSLLLHQKGIGWIKSQEEEISKEKSILWIPLSKFLFLFFPLGVILKR